MFFEAFGFTRDDEMFFQDVYDPETRGPLLSQLSGQRKRCLTVWYLFIIVGFLFVFAGYQTRSFSVWAGIVLLYFAYAFFIFSLHADSKYKLVKTIDMLEQTKKESPPQSNQ